MANKHTEFWLALLDLSEDTDHRVRLWNGYLGWKLPFGIKGEIDPKGGWPQLIVTPPDGGWPRLTKEEREQLEALAKTHGGHPELKHEYMDFSGHTFSEDVDLSGLTLILSHFDKARFQGRLQLSEKTQFYAQSWFHDARFDGGLFCKQARFHAPVSFDGSCFNRGAIFLGTEFMGGASFANAVFEEYAMFNDSKFEERYFSGVLPFQFSRTSGKPNSRPEHHFAKYFLETTTKPIREDYGLSAEPTSVTLSLAVLRLFAERSLQALRPFSTPRFTRTPNLAA